MLICLDQRNGNGCGTPNPTGSLRCNQCSRPLRFALELRDPGTIIGHYQIVHVVGHGGVGAVYQARVLSRPDTHVALKETFDPTSLQSFRSEYALLNRLNHPNLSRYVELFEAEDNGYLVMEFVPGQSLEDVIEKQQGPLLESQVLGYALQLCDILSYLHGQPTPIMHRDIKPANIRLTPEGLIKLVDFGLVKQAAQQTRTAVLNMGTPEYAPPEQYGRGTDQRGDIYSLGATLFHLLTGMCPLSATERIASAVDPLDAAKTLNPALSQRVSDAVATSMSLQRDNRFPDASAFKRSLVGEHSAPDVEHTQPTLRERLTQTLRKNETTTKPAPALTPRTSTPSRRYAPLASEASPASPPVPARPINTASQSYNQRINMDGLALTIVSVDKQESIGGYNDKKAGHVWLVVEVEFEAIASNKGRYYRHHFSLNDDNGLKYNVDTPKERPIIATDDLFEGDRAHGYVAFQVSVDAKGFVLRYEHNGKPFRIPLD